MNIQLKKRERQQLEGIVQKGKQRARTITRCRILLLADKNTKGLSNREIVEALSVCSATISNVVRCFNQEGLESIHDKPRSGQPPKFQGRPAAAITALACSTPPEGRSRWTLELLADRAVTLKIVDSICPQSVHNILKKRDQTALKEAVVYRNHRCGLSLADGKGPGCL